MRSLWVYAYRMEPPQPSSRLGTMRRLLTDETAAARDNARTWSGRFVPGRHVTNILIVSDTPDRNGPINDRLEAELARLDAPFSVTEPLAVAGHTAGVGSPPPHEGEGR